MSEILTIIDAAQAEIDQYRKPNNGGNYEAENRAFETFSALFEHGLEDEEFDGEMTEEFLLDWRDRLDLPICSTSPSDSWTPLEKAKCWRLLGDLFFTHSNDAGLNAAKDAYTKALDLGALPINDTLLCQARLLRSGSYASYGSELFLLNAGIWELDKTATHRPTLMALIADRKDGEDAARTEFEVSLVDIARRNLAFGYALETGEAVVAKHQALICEMIAPVLAELLGRALPYRKSFAWISAGCFASALFDHEEVLKPVREAAGVETNHDLQLKAIESVNQEDGLFYPHGGALKPSSYVEEAQRIAAHLRLDLASHRGDIDTINAIESELHDVDPYRKQDATRLVLALLARNGAGEAFETKMRDVLDRYREEAVDENFYGHYAYSKLFVIGLSESDDSTLTEEIEALIASDRELASSVDLHRR